MDALNTYRQHLEAQGYRAATIDAKLGALRLVAAHADVADLRDLTRGDVLEWITSRPLADRTRSKYLEHVRAWCAWAGLPDLTLDIRRPRQPVGVPRPVSEWDLTQMMNAAEGPVRAWVLLGAYCGLRSFESAKVSVEDLERMPDGTRSLRIEGKGGYVGLVPCPPVVVDELEVWIESARRGRLWPTATPAAVQHRIRRLAERVGVRCSSHQLRHRYGTAAHARTGDLLTTQLLMRHRSPATTAGYAAVASSHLSLVVADLPGARGREAGRAHLRIVR